MSEPDPMAGRHAFRTPASAAALLLISCTALADTLATGIVVAPLAPGQDSRLSFAMPKGFAADQAVWVVYELVALAPDDADSGELTLEQSFEGVMTPVTALYTIFNADDMDSRASAGTIAQRLEQVAGRREPSELKALMGAQLHAAYEAVNAGKGRVLSGRVVARLPAPGTTDAPLRIAVERAEGMQPLALRVTAGQGELPAEFAQKPQDSALYKAGYAAGLAFFGWLAVRLFRRRKH